VTRRTGRFVILNAARTAAIICTLLNSHPEVLCHHEIFNPHVVESHAICKSTVPTGTIKTDRIRRVPATSGKPRSPPVCGIQALLAQHEIAYAPYSTTPGAQDLAQAKEPR